MKKVISLLLALVMCLCMCACGENSGGEKSDAIELTLDNYEQYFKVNKCRLDYISKGVQVGYLGNLSRVYQINGLFEVEGASLNFNYNNVKFKVQFSGTYGTTKLASANMDADENSQQSFDEIVEVSVNIAGSGKWYDKLVLAPDGKAIVDVNYEEAIIIGISGTVSPA